MRASPHRKGRELDLSLALESPDASFQFALLLGGKLAFGVSESPLQLPELQQALTLRRISFGFGCRVLICKHVKNEDCQKDLERREG